MSEDAEIVPLQVERRQNRSRKAATTPRTVPAWHSHLIVTDKHKPKPLLANAITALRQAPEWRGVLGFDEFSRKIILRGRAPWQPETSTSEAWASTHDVLVTDWLQHQGIHVRPDTAAAAVEVVAVENGFHPVRDYLSALRWDGNHRLDTWAIKFLGAPETEFAQAVAARWLISGVARIMAPGCKADCALILEGPQGILKSTALKTLAQPWFTDELSDVGSKDAALQLSGAWVIELSELDSLSRTDTAKVKAFMSRPVDRYRPPYARHVIEVPRQCIFGGTVNHDQYLRDETGGRRFWPIECTKIDIPGLSDTRDQLWAEARDRYHADEPWWLDTSGLNREAHDEQQARYQGDPWDEPIREWIGIKDEVTIADVLQCVLSKNVSDRTQGDANRVARSLKGLGFLRFQERRGQRRAWVYRRSSPVSPDEE